MRTFGGGIRSIRSRRQTGLRKVSVFRLGRGMRALVDVFARRPDRGRRRGTEHRRSVISAGPAAAAAAAVAAAAASAGQCKSQPRPGRGAVLFVEEVERRQAHVADFLVGHRDMMFRGCSRRHVHDLRIDARGCSGRERERQAGGPQCRHRPTLALSFRSLLGLQHGNTSATV